MSAYTHGCVVIHAVGAFYFLVVVAAKVKGNRKEGNKKIGRGKPWERSAWPAMRQPFRRRRETTKESSRSKYSCGSVKRAHDASKRTCDGERRGGRSQRQRVESEPMKGRRGKKRGQRRYSVSDETPTSTPSPPPSHRPFALFARRTEIRRASHIHPFTTDRAGASIVSLHSTYHHCCALMRCTHAHPKVSLRTRTLDLDGVHALGELVCLAHLARRLAVLLVLLQR